MYEKDVRVAQRPWITDCNGCISSYLHTLYIIFYIFFFLRYLDIFLSLCFMLYHLLTYIFHYISLRSRAIRRLVSKKCRLRQAYIHIYINIYIYIIYHIIYICQTLEGCQDIQHLVLGNPEVLCLNSSNISGWDATSCNPWGLERPITSLFFSGLG